MTKSRHAEVAIHDRPELFVRKVHQCFVIFDFNDASSELRGKQIKAQTLHEMLDYITTQRGVITEAIYPEVVAMVREFYFSGLSLLTTKSSSQQICSALYPHKSIPPVMRLTQRRMS